MVNQLVQSGKYRRRLDLFYLMLKEFFNSDKLQPGQKIFCFVPKSGRFTTVYMMLTYGYLMTANNLDKPALTTNNLHQLCLRSNRKNVHWDCSPWGAGVSDYSFPTYSGSQKSEVCPMPTEAYALCPRRPMPSRTSSF
jgi:hypothetical protein